MRMLVHRLTRDQGWILICATDADKDGGCWSVRAWSAMDPFGDRRQPKIDRYLDASSCDTFIRDTIAELIEQGRWTLKTTPVVVEILEPPSTIGDGMMEKWVNHIVEAAGSRMLNGAVVW